MCSAVNLQLARHLVKAMAEFSNATMEAIGNVLKHSPVAWKTVLVIKC